MSVSYLHVCVCIVIVFHKKDWTTMDRQWCMNFVAVLWPILPYIWCASHAVLVRCVLVHGAVCWQYILVHTVHTITFNQWVVNAMLQWELKPYFSGCN